MIGYAFCGSFCTHKASLAVLRTLCEEGYCVQPLFSEAVQHTDTRFGRAKDLYDTVYQLCGRKPICSIAQAEPLGPKEPLDALILSPCTGNTLAKLANGITDTTVCMAAKAHLRTDRPLLIALATNDAMSANLSNIATMLLRKSVHFVPMFQDDCQNKPHSLVADFSRIPALLADLLKSPPAPQARPLFL